MRPGALVVLAVLVVLPPLTARAHHEALFGPQSSLAVEAEAFASLQTHAHAYGVRGQETTEVTTLVSGGIQPLSIPLGLSLIQPFTFQTVAKGCNRCTRLENTLVDVHYRVDFERLQKSWDKDGNFALVSGAIELPFGNKDYPPLVGPVNFITAAMAGLEKGAWSMVALGYYRANTLDFGQSKKGDNAFAALGFAWTPIDRADLMLSVQLGVGYEYHWRDLLHGAEVDQSGGGQLLLSPTLVGSPLEHLRIFLSGTFAPWQSMRGDANVERWRAGAGVIYTFDRHSR